MYSSSESKEIATDTTSSTHNPTLRPSARNMWQFPAVLSSDKERDVTQSRDIP